MNNGIKTANVNLDDIHSVKIAVNEKAKTVVAELIVNDESTFIYAEKFDAPCNYLRTAIKKSIVYLNGDISESEINEKKRIGKKCISLNMNGYMI